MSAGGEIESLCLIEMYGYYELLVLLDSIGASVNVKRALTVTTLLKEVASLGNKCQIRVGDLD